MKIHLTGMMWHGALSVYLGDGLRALGHDIQFFDEGGPRKLAFMKKIGARLSRHPYTLDDKFREKVGELWLESIRAYAPDLIVIEYAPNLMPKFIERARSFGKPISYWMTSPPDGFQAKEMLLGMPFVDHFFSIDRDWMHFMQKFVPQKKILHMPLAGDDGIFKPLSLDHEARERDSSYDLAFVGSFTPQDASASWRGFLLSAIPAKYNLGIFGNGVAYWQKYFPRLAAVFRGPGMSAEKLNELYNRTKIVLNIHSPGHLKSISARTFETGLSGAFQLIEFREDLELCFPRDTFATFEYREDMLRQIEAWLAKPKERWDNADRIRQMVLEKHLWKHRAKFLLDNLNP